MSASESFVCEGVTSVIPNVELSGIPSASEGNEADSAGVVEAAGTPIFNFISANS